MPKMSNFRLITSQKVQFKSGVFIENLTELTREPLPLGSTIFLISPAIIEFVEKLNQNA